MARKYLIVDDSMVARMLLANVLKSLDTIITEAGDGETALQILESSSTFDAVFLDITMPGISGLDVLRQIKQQTPNQPVIIVTADIQKQTIANALAAGAFAVIAKKIDPNLVQTVLSRLFGEAVTT